MKEIIKKIINSRIVQYKWFLLFIVVVLFIISVIVRFIIACDNNSNIIGTIYDELYYYLMGSSFANGNGFCVYNVPNSFSKVLYAIVISPAFIFTASADSHFGVFLINSIIMSAGVFPIYYLSGKILKSKVNVFISCVLYLILANHYFTMTYMAENLYLPLTLFTICFFYKVFECRDTTPIKKKIILNLAAGFLTYLDYQTKEVALAFFIAYIGVLITLPVYRLIIRSKKIEILSFVIQMVSYIVGFYLPIFLTRLGAAKSSYSIKSVAATVSTNTVGNKIQYLFYGFFFTVCITVLAAFVIPVIFSGVYFDKLALPTRKFYTFLIYSILITSFVISYTILLWENYPSLTPRMHTRYIDWVVMPFIIIFLHLTENMDKECIKNSLGRLGYVALFLLLLVVFFRGGDRYGPIDSTLSITSVMKNDNVLYFTVIISVLCVAAFFIFSKKAKALSTLFILFFASVQIYDYSSSMPLVRREYLFNAPITEYAKKFSAFVDEHPDEYFLVVEQDVSVFQKVMATYLPQMNVYTTNRDFLVNLGDKEEFTFSDLTFRTVWGNGKYESVDVDYILCEPGYMPPFEKGESFQKLEEFSNNAFEVYKVDGVVKRKSLVGGGYIGFSDDDLDGFWYAKKGLSSCEGSFAWIMGSEMDLKEFKLSAEGGTEIFTMNIMCDRIITNQQRLIINCNSETIFDEVIDQSEVRSIIVPVKTDSNGMLDLQFILPDAVSPKELGINDDSRPLSFALKKISFGKIPGIDSADWDGVIGFNANNNNSATYVTKGTSYCEGDFTWLVGDNIAFREVMLPGKEEAYNMNISWMQIFGESQELTVLCNSETVYKGTIKSTDPPSLTIPVKTDADGHLRLEFCIPSAISPKDMGLSEDSRKLSIAINEIYFEKNSGIKDLEGGGVIGFTAENSGGLHFVDHGVSVCEGDFTWLEGDSVVFKEINLSDDEKNEIYNMNIEWYNVFADSQELIVLCNSEVVYQDTVSLSEIKNVEFPIITDSNGNVKLEFRLPDAVAPKDVGQSDDNRLLSLALKEISLKKAS